MIYDIIGEVLRKIAPAVLFFGSVAVRYLVAETLMLKILRKVW